ncbi:MAG: hypothetical protein AAF409_14500 [Pseudomonadota bacterium]
MTDPKTLTDTDLEAAMGGATEIGALSHVPGAKKTRERGPDVDVFQRGPGEVGYDVDIDLDGNDW